MNPLKLTLRGFKGIKAGLGVDEVIVDLTLDGDLIAITGPNGSGKTTILDNIHPYRIMPSRASGYSTASFSYFDHTYLGDSKKALLWEHEGVTYESTILIKASGKTTKQECYLAIVDDDGKHPVRLPDGTIADGKTKTYDACIEHIVGSPELFFTAAFSCQGRKTLADYPAGDVKALMSALLGLDEYRVMAGQANDEAKAGRARLDTLRTRVARAEVVDQTLVTERDALGSAEFAVTDITATRENLRTAATAAEQRLLEARTNAAGFAETERRRETLTTQIGQMRARRTTTAASMSADATAAGEAANTEVARARSTIESADEAIIRAGDRENRAAGILARQKEVNRAVEDLPTLQRQLADAQAAVATAEEADRQRTALDRRIAELRGTLSEQRTAGEAVKATCARLTQQSALTDEVPCVGTDLQGRCKLLADAVAAKATIPTHEADLAAKRAQYEATLKDLKAAEADLEAMGDTGSMLQGAQKAASEIAKTLQTVHATAALADRMADAERDATEAEAERRRHEAAIKEARAAAAAAAERVAAIKDEWGGRITAALAAIDEEIATVQRELDALPPTDAASLRAAEEAESKARQAVDLADRDLVAAQSRVTERQGRIAALEQEKASLAEDAKRFRAEEDDVANWTLLAKALGNDGIIALSIDDAGPSLTAIANDLLLECYGPRFTVELITQEPTKAGVLKETMDLVVHDAERGDSKSIAQVSGGERIYINEVVTCAIGVYRARASGHAYECRFADESDGALDSDKKRQWARMKKVALRLSGFKREIFISHSAEVQECADATIHVPSLAA